MGRVEMRLKSRRAGGSVGVFALCGDRGCGFAYRFVDVRNVPAACPVCGDRLITLCPSCAAPLRSNSGRCSRCGKSIYRRTPVPTSPARAELG